MATICDRKKIRKKKRARVRTKIRGTDAKPRLCVFRSLRYTYVQLISDESGSVIGAVSSKQIEADGKSPAGVESAKALGMSVASLAKEKNINEVVFDRNGYLYHGRVAAVADGAREGGLKF